MTREEKSILLALCIGDGCLRKPDKNGGVQLEIGHSKKQYDYIAWKSDLLHSICGGKKPVIHERVVLGKYDTCRIFKMNPYFKIIRKWMTRFDKKVLTRTILNRLTPLGIAIWYMDDGSLYKWYNKNTGGYSRRQITLATYCFSYEEHIIMRDYFLEVHNVRFSIIRYHHQYKLVCGANEGLKFIEIVKPHILPLFNYKIDFGYKDTSPRQQRFKGIPVDDIVCTVGMDKPTEALDKEP